MWVLSCPFSLPHSSILSLLPPSRWWQWVALTSRRIPAPSQPLSSTMSTKVYTHIHVSHMHTCIFIIYITVTVYIHIHTHIYLCMYAYMSTYLSLPLPLSLRYIYMLFNNPYLFIISTIGFYLPTNYRAVTNPTITHYVRSN